MRMPTAALIYLSALLLVGGAGPRPLKSTSTRQRSLSLPSRSVKSFNVERVPLVEAILLLGQRENIPLGVEYVDEQSLTTPISVHSGPTTVGRALLLILASSRGYSWREQYGAVIISSLHTPPAALRLLARVVPAFDAPSSTIEDLSNGLQIRVQRELHQNVAGWGGSFLSVGRPVPAGPLHLRNVTVREALCRIVNGKHPAAWVLDAYAAALREPPRGELWKVLPYTSPPTPYAELLRAWGFGSRGAGNRGP